MFCIESISINNIINIIVLESSFKVKNEAIYLQKNFVGILLNSILLVKTSMNKNNIPNNMNIKILLIHQYLLL